VNLCDMLWPPISRRPAKGDLEQMCERFRDTVGTTALDDVLKEPLTLAEITFNQALLAFAMGRHLPVCAQVFTSIRRPAASGSRGIWTSSIPFR